MKPCKKRGAFVAPRVMAPAVAQPTDKDREEAEHIKQPGHTHTNVAGGVELRIACQQGSASALAAPAVPSTACTARKPLSVKLKCQPQQPALNSLPARANAQEEEQFLSVLYIKKEAFMKKKVAKAYLDGVLALNADGTSTLHSVDTGKVVSTGRAKKACLKDLQGFAPQPRKKPGKAKGGCSDDEASDEDDDIVRYLLGTFVVEVQQPVAADTFRSGACFTAAVPTYGPNKTCTTGSKPPGPAGSLNGFRPVARPAGDQDSVTGCKAAVRQTALKGLYDPHAPGAILLNEAEWRAALSTGCGPAVAAVMVDPYLGRHLRPHQVEGVRFMYECVMGKREPQQTGCLLADEMGLGKTLQVITLLWTLLRQGPTGKPVANKVIVVTPATLCGNWAAEVRSWLGNERLQVFSLGQQADAKDQVQQFKYGTVVKLCITSYETLRKHADALAGVFDVLVCDEGHRLKAVGGTKTTQALLHLGCARRILLTGTPIQNNLEEFYALVSFVAPDLLGAAAAFRRVYAEPIARAQERDATAEVKALGASRAAELTRKVSCVLLRRTQALLTKHLPPLINYVLFCRPSPLQVLVYQHVLKRVLAGMAARGAQEDTLGALTALRKVCNHPGLLSSRGDEAQNQGVTDADGSSRPTKAAKTLGKAAQSAAAVASTSEAGVVRDGTASSWVPVGVDLELNNADASGKLAVLRLLLGSIIASGERLVIVSTSTVALDMVTRLCTQPMGLRTVRIDGSTSVDERQSIVDAFNTRGIGQVFLLSTRAGGAGLNLIGANHLVLLDSDWNPAADQQAMARIWRDGQWRPCSVWRLLTTGTLEEKIYQRQIMKGSLASATIAKAETIGSTAGGGGDSRSFTQEELRALFVLNTTTACETRDLQATHSASMQPHMHWLDVNTSPAATSEPDPAVGQAAGHADGLTAGMQCGSLAGSSAGMHAAATPAPALQAVLSSGLVTAANMLLKSEELEQGSPTNSTINCPTSPAQPPTNSAANQQQQGGSSSPVAKPELSDEVSVGGKQQQSKRRRVLQLCDSDEEMDLPSESQ